MQSGGPLTIGLLLSSSYISICKVKDFVDSLVSANKKITAFQYGHIVCWFPLMPLSRKEITKRMVELARKYVETHDPEIIKELYKLGRELEKMEKSEKP